jgi:hypothetical protein
VRNRRLLVASSAVVAGLGLAAACSRVSAPGNSAATSASDPVGFVAKANATLLEQAGTLARAQWVAANFITEDTEQISAAATADYVATSMRLAKQSRASCCSSSLPPARSLHRQTMRSRRNSPASSPAWKPLTDAAGTAHRARNARRSTT